MRRTWTDILPALALATALGGCATSKDALLVRGDRTMRDIWDAQTAGQAAPSRLMEARQQLRRPLDSAEQHARHTAQHAYTRTAHNEIQRQFARLPNPDLLMFVFPHLAGADPVPVPGYTTVFPLYQRVQYALPGERTEDY